MKILTEDKKKKIKNIWNTFITLLFSVIAIIISLISLNLSCEANRITKNKFNFDIGIQRARIILELLSPKIKIEPNSTGFRVTAYVKLRNIGKSSARIIYPGTQVSLTPENSDIPVVADNSAINIMNIKIPNPSLIEPGDHFWFSPSFELRHPDQIETERLRKEIEEGKIKMQINALIKYLDIVTKREYSLSFVESFDKLGVTFSSFSDE